MKLARNTLLFHGTGARRKQSIEQKGLVPILGSYVHATTDVAMATIFAVARADHETDDGLILVFKAGNGWKEDPTFPSSYIRKSKVPRKSILFLMIIDPKKEGGLFDAYRHKVKEYGILFPE